MLSVIQLLHDSMQAKVRAEGEQTDTIKVNKGLHQGCTLAPVLFNIYFSAVVAQWRSSCPCAGLNLGTDQARNWLGTVRQCFASCIP